MLKKIVLLCFTTIFSFADFEIDPDIEKHIDRYEVNSVEMIVNYYIDKDIKKAKAINDKVLMLHPNNPLALKNKKIIEEKLAKRVRSANNMENTDNMDSQKLLSDDSLISDMQNDYQKLLKAKSFFNNKDYLKVQQILNGVKNKSALEFIKLKAYSCFEMHNYKCAEKYLSTLYSSTYSIKDAYKLIETYIKINKKKKALKFVNLLLTQYKGDRILKEYKKKLTSIHSSFEQASRVVDDFSSNNTIVPKELSTTNNIDKLLENYKRFPSFSNLNKLVSNMRKLGQKQESYYYLNQYFLKHPEADDIKYLYAKYLYKDNKYKKAIYILESITLRSKNRELVLKSKEMLGLIYYKLGNYSKAKSLLYPISKYTTSKEVKDIINSMNNNMSSNYSDISNVDERIKPQRVVHNLNRQVLSNPDAIGDLDFATLEERYNTTSHTIIKPKKIIKKRRVEKLNALEFKPTQIKTKKGSKNHNDFSLNEINSTEIDFSNFNFDTASVSDTPSNEEISIMKRRNHIKTKRSNVSRKTDLFFDESSFEETSSQPIPQNVKDFIYQWKKGWESRNIDMYSKFYADKYKLNSRWLARKERIFSRTSFISLKLNNFNLLDHYNQNGVDVYKVRFYQVYSTDSKTDKGYKTLTLKCLNNRCLIYKENWSRAY